MASNAMASADPSSQIRAAAVCRWHQVRRHLRDARISERKQAEALQQQKLESQVLQRTADLEAAVARANVANRAKSDFLAMISHEIRTPLSGVIGSMELLATSTLDESQRRFVNAANTSGQHLLALLNDLLDLARIEAGEMRLERRSIDLRELVDEALAPFIATAAAKGLMLDAMVAPELPPRVWGDPLRMRQVLVNLIGNAVKFTQHGTVCVRLSGVPGLRFDASRIAVRFEVEDSGIGIRAEALKHIFDAFGQAEDSTARHYGGTGLGLSISARLVRMMGGELRVRSEPGDGSSFDFALLLDSELDSEA